MGRLFVLDVLIPCDFGALWGKCISGYITMQLFHKSTSFELTFTPFKSETVQKQTDSVL